MLLPPRTTNVTPPLYHTRQALHMSESDPSNRDDVRLLPLWSAAHTRQGLS